MKRMKSHIVDAVKANSKPMFGTCTTSTRKQLKDMQTKVSGLMENFLDKLFSEIDRDYMKAIVGGGPGDCGVRREELNMRITLQQVVRKVNKILLTLVSSDDVKAAEGIETLGDEKVDNEDDGVQDEEDAAKVIAEKWIKDLVEEASAKPDKVHEKAALATPPAENGRS